MNKKNLLRILLLLLAGIVIGNLLTKRQKRPATTPRDYAEIATEGVLHAATEYNRKSFFVAGDTLGGFHYELINAFARAHGLKAEVMPEMEFDNRMEALATGKCDIIAHSTPISSDMRDSVLLSTPLLRSKLVLVQRRDTGNLFVKTHLDLAGRTLHVVKGAPSIQRIRNLSNEIADTIYVKEVEKYGTEQLISLVAHGDIDYAVCDEQLALASADSFPQIDLHIAIGFSQFHSWATSKKSPALMDSINAWLSEYQKSEEYRALMKKYY